jgi:hypothetical protein
MKTFRFAFPLIILLFLSTLQSPTITIASTDGNSLAGDALHPPPHPPALATFSDFRPTPYQPSAFLAGRVAVQAIFVESDGSKEPSTRNWTPEQVTIIQNQLAAALDWWRGRLPNARLSFDLTSQIVPSGYEPILHSLSTEGEWAGDTLRQMGFGNSNYFEQAYNADESLRRVRHADWATTIFVVNSAGKADGRFADGRFAYAYVGGPFLVVTSDAGPYGTKQIAPVVAHELGHIFGALDQYAAAATPCTQRSGYLAVPTTNSQANNCGSRLICIMLEPLPAYSGAEIDPSALGQVGYRDTDGDGIPDPLDTTPTIDFQIMQPSNGGRPTIIGTATDQPFPSPTDQPATINTIVKIEYRVDGGAWIALAPDDGAFDRAAETVKAILPLYDGQHVVELRAINSVGVTSATASSSLTVEGVGAAPAYAVSAPKINNTDTITVSLSAPAGTTTQISEDPFFSGAAWMPAVPSVIWRLIGNDGAHTLYARFRDATGLESPPFARVILLDRTPPTGRVTLRANVPPLLEIQATDNASGVNAMQILADGSAGDWQPYQSLLPLSNIIATPNQLRIRLRDAAGNISQPLAVAVPIYVPIVQR